MNPFDLRLWPRFEEAGGTLDKSTIVNQIIIDSRRINTPQSLFVALPGTLSDGHNFVSSLSSHFALVKKNWIFNEILPPNLTLLRVEDPLEAFQEIAHIYRKNLKTPIIAISGSYGKTMVKDFLHAILSQSKKAMASPESFNSQIGVPLSLLTINQQHEIAIIEAGISTQGEMDILSNVIEPDFVILTQIGKKHLATLKDLNTVAKEYAKLTYHASKNWSLIPKNTFLSSHTQEISHYFWNEESSHLPHAFSSSSCHNHLMSYQVKFPDGNIYEGETTFGFYYFLDLINICIKAAWLLGISSKTISNTLKAYTPEPMRTEIWKSPLGSIFINDTYSSDPQSIDQALKYLDQIANKQHRKFFAFGGLKNKTLHQENHSRRIGQAITKHHIHFLFLFGPHDFSSLIKDVKDLSPHTQILVSKDYSHLLSQLTTEITANDVILIKGERKEHLDTLIQRFDDSLHSNQCRINLAAVQSNISMLRHKLPKGNRMMVIVKAFAYGTDEVRMAKFLQTCGVDILGVSSVEEGVSLKKAGVVQNIFTLHASFYEIAKAVKWDLEIAVSSQEFVHLLANEALKQSKIIKVHLHVDTGMGRFGCRPEEALNLAKAILSCSSLFLEGIMTHFSCADDPENDEFTFQQVKKFQTAIGEIEKENIHIPWKHAANSSASIRFDLPEFNMVRIGLAVYGLYPSAATKSLLDLRLAISLTSRIVGINFCKKGDTVSYGKSYTVEKEEQRIAVLPIGYFDGLHRHFSGKGYVMIRGHKAPMVGKICMDFMMIDVTDVPHASIGDNVLFFGEDEYGNYLAPEEFALKSDSIVYELVTCLGPRIPRIFILEEGHQRY